MAAGGDETRKMMGDLGLASERVSPGLGFSVCFFFGFWAVWEYDYFRFLGLKLRLGEEGLGSGIS